jgi:predicted regulator of Ras-like GTPase activity (Roadblock/LC7/MglB family)
MSAKSKFAGLLRGWWRRFDDAEPVEPEASIPDYADQTAVQPADDLPVTEEVVAEAVMQEELPTVPAPAASPDGLQLPLQPILDSMPIELRAQVVNSDTANMVVAIPVMQVLSQLATGSVKISFGELRQLAPDVFAVSSVENDAKLVALPLNQILSQINPALLSRRPTQKQIQVSDDVAGPFNAQGEGLTITTAAPKTPAAPPPPVERPPLSRFAPPVGETPQPIPVVPPPAFVPRWNAPAANGNANGNGNGHRNGNGAAHGSNGNGTNGSHRSASFNVPPPAAAKVIPVAPAPLPQSLVVPLAALSESWPDALNLEIAQLDLTNAQVALPVTQVEPALKRGRVVFAWRDLRSWLKNVAVAASVHDGTELELPLKVLAPLFFALQKNGGGQKKISVTEEIPNLFFGFPQPASAPTPPPPTALAVATPPPDTNFFPRSLQPETTDSEFKRKGGTDFLSRGLTPADVVARTMEMPGVAGALIALPDGLKVASQIPAELNGDTLAAFLPQLFARVNQCSRELRMGDMNNLSFTVGGVPWKIFRVNAVYFAAFGRSNASLPGAQLAALATELDRKRI